MSITLYVQRHGEVGNATLGTLTACGVATILPQIHTLEDRWRENAKGVSCIPAGTYRAVPHGWKTTEAVKFKKVWRLLDVPKRDAILIHAGNSDADTEGCILVGMKKAGDRIVESVKALDLLRQSIGEQSMTVVVRDYK
ncbi:DUF5675 family protein [Methylorubrum sp. SB2]|uniref:DUF5675 family protein n=1 Tax=Methylorubrum subtropicum TaxID=3138812 RepID=UPI00313D40A7